MTLKILCDQHGIGIEKLMVGQEIERRGSTIAQH
jgi:hypothetical protein